VSDLYIRDQDGGEPESRTRDRNHSKENHYESLLQAAPSKTRSLGPGVSKKKVSSRRIVIETGSKVHDDASRREEIQSGKRKQLCGSYAEHYDRADDGKS